MVLGVELGSLSGLPFPLSFRTLSVDMELLDDLSFDSFALLATVVQNKVDIGSI